MVWLDRVMKGGSGSDAHKDETKLDMKILSSMMVAGHGFGFSQPSRQPVVDAIRRIFR